MMTITYSEEDGEGNLRCQFCGETADLPFGIVVQGETTNPTPEDIIREHNDQSLADEAERIQSCPKWNLWITTQWEVRERSDREHRLWGDVIVDKVTREIRAVTTTGGTTSVTTPPSN